MSKVIVTYVFNGEIFFLKGTIWSFARERAQEFDSVEAAKASLAKRHRIVGGMGYPKRKLKHELETVKFQEVEA